MAEVSFYVLPSDATEGRYQFLCKLVEKAYRERHRVYILTAAPEQTQVLDDLLWTFRAGSFIPHEVNNGTPPGPENAVVIGTADAPPGWRQLLINLAPDIPANPDGYERIVEILDNNDHCKQAGRQRYRRYQAANLRITTHTL